MKPLMQCWKLALFIFMGLMSLVILPGHTSSHTGPPGAAITTSKTVQSIKVAQTCTPPPAGMVAWLPGDGNPNDITANGNNGTLQNGATFAAGEVNQAFSFDGTDDYVSINDAASLHLTTFTVDAWVNVSDTKQEHDILTKQTFSQISGNEFAYGVRSLPGGQLEGRITDASGNVSSVTSSSNLTAAAFHHVAFTYDGAALKLYLDGQLVGTTATTATPVQSTQPVIVGAFATTTSGVVDFFKGAIDEVELFNRALSQTEIQAIVNSGSAGKCRTCTPPPANLQNWWTGDGSANDFKGNNNGTWQGTEGYAAGMVAQAFNFNGSSAVFIPASGSNLVMGTNDFTLDAWINTSAATEQFIFTFGYINAAQTNISNVSLFIDPQHHAVMFIRDAAGNTVTATSIRAVNDGLWHHLAGSRQGTTARIYVDGVQEGSASNASLGSVDTNCGTAFIGAINSTQDCPTTATENFFNGLIDEVELFKGRALTSAEINAIVNAGNAGKCKTVAGCTITCPANIIKSNDTNQCGAVTTYTAPTTTGTCGTVSCSPSSGSFFPKGTTTVACTTTAGPSCSFTVTVQDTQPPAIACPANVTAAGIPSCPSSGSGTIVSYPTPTSTDNCPGVTTQCTPPSGSTFPTGTTSVTCTATDASGNTAMCSFRVTVFSGCLQDDANPGTVVLFNTQTGDYRFCCNGTAFTGKGTVAVRGCIVQIEQNAVDRRVLIKADFSTRTGTASLQVPPGTTRCTISDRNTSNNTCLCGSGGV